MQSPPTVVWCLRDSRLPIVRSAWLSTQHCSVTAQQSPRRGACPGACRILRVFLRLRSRKPLFTEEILAALWGERPETYIWRDHSWDQRCSCGGSLSKSDLETSPSCARSSSEVFAALPGDPQSRFWVSRWTLFVCAWKSTLEDV